MNLNYILSITVLLRASLDLLKYMYLLLTNIARASKSARGRGASELSAPHLFPKRQS